MSDRDRYKRERDSAARDVGRHKSERARIKSDLDEAHAAVRRIKEARQVMFDLNKEGFDKRIVSSAICNGGDNVRSIETEISGLAIGRNDFIHQAKLSLGVFTLETEICRLRLEREAQIKAFDGELMVAERKAKHRAEWLAAHGK